MKIFQFGFAEAQPRTRVLPVAGVYCWCVLLCCCCCCCCNERKGIRNHILPVSFVSSPGVLLRQIYVAPLFVKQFSSFHVSCYFLYVCNINGLFGTRVTLGNQNLKKQLFFINLVNSKSSMQIFSNFSKLSLHSIF